MKKITLIAVMVCAMAISSYAGIIIDLENGFRYHLIGGCRGASGWCLNEPDDATSPMGTANYDFVTNILTVTIPTTSPFYSSLGTEVTFDADGPINPTVSNDLGIADGYTIYIPEGTYIIMYSSDGTATVSFPTHIERI